MKIKSKLLNISLIFIMGMLLLPLCASASTYYVSSSGSDSNNGLFSSSPLKTISAAYTKDKTDKTIVVLDNVSYTDATSDYTFNVTIKGNAQSVVLTLPSTVSPKGNLKIDNITLSGASTIYANGHTFEIASSVTSANTSNRMTVYGGKNTAYTGNTDIRLYGGHYNNIYGGCNGAALTGSTNVIVGGNVNSGDGIDDSNSSTISPCYIYGGGNNGKVSGKTNVTLTGNAVTKYIVGAGNGTGGLATYTNVFIEGGKVMNVYAGSKNAPLSGCDTHITMTGGLAEALFGGCESTSMTGNTYLTLLGGDVSRRVYTGCYNNRTTSGWSSSYYVTGTTTLSIGPNMKLNTKNGLSSDNQDNIGVFSGSRIKKNSNSGEYNTIIYLDGCYSSQKSTIGEKSLKGMIAGMVSSEKYTINAAAGGLVEGTNTAGVIKVTPDKDNYAVVGSTSYKAGNVSIGTGTTAVTFPVNFAVNSITASDSSVTVDTTAVNVWGETSPTLYCAIYDNSSKKLLGVKTFAAATQSKTFDFSDVITSGTSFTAKAFILNDKASPLCVSKNS